MRIILSRCWGRVKGRGVGGGASIAPLIGISCLGSAVWDQLIEII